MNPTQDVVEQRVAALEGGVGALLVASGQAAETLAILNIAEAGDHIVSSPALYGGTYNLFHYTLPKLGHRRRLRRPNPTTPSPGARRSSPNTKAFFAETIGNPQLDILDIEARRRRRARGRRAADRRQHGRPRRTSSGRSSTARTSSCTRRPSTSAATAPRSAASSSTAASSTGRADAERFPGFNTPDPSYHGLIYGADLGAGRPVQGATSPTSSRRGCSCCATSARRSRRSTRSCSRRASRRCRCGSSGTSRTPRRSPSGSAAATRWCR